MIWIASDSGCEWREDPERNYYSIPLQVLIEEDSFAGNDGVDMEKFYEKMDQKIMPKTSLPKGEDVEALFEKAKKAGARLILITISSCLSGTWNLCRMLAEDYDNVDVIDSQNVTFGQNILVRRAMELREQNLDAETICEILEKEKNEIVLAATVDTLEYLKNGGRVSPAVATIGDLLNVKPLLAVEKGEVVSNGKTRGMKKAIHKIAQTAIEDMDPNRPCMFGYSGPVGKPFAAQLAEEVSQETGCTHTDLVQASLALCAHTGPGASAMAYFRKQK